jgi:hypothetical protein
MRPLFVVSIALACTVLSAQTVTLVDVQRVPVTGDYRTALVKVTVPAQPEEIACDLAVAGAGAGGVIAAIRAAERGVSVCLTEETDTIGGQFHSVPALDEHKWIEITGATRSYLEFRERIRNHYRQKYKLTAAYKDLANLNPGACYVSSLCYEPSVAVDLLTRMVRDQKLIRLLKRTKVFDADVQNQEVRSLLAYDFARNQVMRLRTRFVLDATEMGDLLPILKIPYAVGSEPKSNTGEPHAAPQPNPACVQSFTYTFAAEHREGEDNRIAKPEGYERIRDSQPFGLTFNYPIEFGWRGSYTYKVFGDDPAIPNNMSPRPFFPWRRMLATKVLDGVKRDVALMNWPRQDYHDESVLDRTPEDTARILQAAKRVAYSFLYWMQTDIPRDDASGKGYPGFALRKDIMGSEDGLSKYPYIRESRRILPLKSSSDARVREQDLNIDSETENRARFLNDAIGTGFYMVDIHPCGANERGRMMMPKPFQVPYSALRPQEVRNFLPAAKNLGVTHLTNGAFRLHPIEWNVGEAAAVAASLALKFGKLPEASMLQRELLNLGVPLVWFDDLPQWHSAFVAIQLAALQGAYPLDKTNLHASPDSPLTRREAAEALSALQGDALKGKAAIDHAVKQGWMAVDHRNWFHEDLPLYWTDIREDKLARALPPWKLKRTGPVTRAEWAQRITSATTP